MRYFNENSEEIFKYFFTSRVFAYLSIIISIAILYHSSFECLFRTEDFALINKARYNFSFYNSFVTEYFNAKFYRPIPNSLFFFISYAFFELNPIGYRVINIILFILSVFLVYEITSILSKRKDLAFVASIFYLSRCLHLKNSYWIVAGFQGNGVAFWIFCTILLYLKYINSKNSLFYIFSLICSIFASLTKEVSVILPALILLIEAYTQTSKRSFNYKNLLLRAFPFFLITSIFYLPRIYFLRPLILDSPYKMQFSLNVFLKNIAFYTFNSFNNYLEIVLLGTLSLIAFVNSENRKYAIFFASWFFIGLIPYLFIAKHPEAYYLNISLLGLSIVLSTGMKYIYEKFCSMKYLLTIVLLSVCILSARINIHTSEFVKEFYVYQKYINNFSSDFKKEFPSFPEDSLIYIKNTPSHAIRTMGWGGTISSLYKSKVTVYFEDFSKEFPDKYARIYFFKYDKNSNTLKFISDLDYKNLEKLKTLGYIE